MGTSKGDSVEARVVYRLPPPPPGKAVSTPKREGGPIAENCLGDPRRGDAPGDRARSARGPA